MLRKMNFNTDTDVNESEFEDIREYQEIKDEKIVYEILGDFIYLYNFREEESFDFLFNRFIDVGVLIWNQKYHKTDCLQHMQIRFKYKAEDEMTYTLPFNRFMISLAFIRPVVKYIDNGHLPNFFIGEALTVKMRGKIQDTIVETLQHEGYTIEDIKDEIATMSLQLKQLLQIFSEADMKVFTAGNMFLDHYREEPEVREINNTEYPSTMQTADIVESNKKKYERLNEIMIKRGNPAFACNKYTKVLKPKQVEESYINFSQIPDGKNIVPIIMNGNGFKQGYATIPIMFAGAISARVPDIMNERYMGSAGYFQRNLMILTSGTISKTVYDCGSKNPLPIIVDETVLSMCEGRYYYRNKNSKLLRCLRKTDTDLIGETIWMRSPCTCNLNEDKCHVCYGSLALKVGNLKSGFIYTTSQTTMVVVASVLQVKHILKADAEPVVFTETFDKWFNLDSSAAAPKEEKKFDIYIKEDWNDDIANGFKCYIGKDMIEVGITHYASIHILDYVFDIAKEVIIDDETYYKVSSFKILEHGGVFCNITPISISSSAVFMNIMHMFEPGSNGITKYQKIEDAVWDLMHMIHKNIDVLSTHGEIMLAGLIRRADNKLLKPDWTQEDPEYQLMPLKMALQNSESATVGMAFEQTRLHMLSQKLEERNKINRVGPRSFCDFLFGEDTL